MGSWCFATAVPAEHHFSEQQKIFRCIGIQSNERIFHRNGNGLIFIASKKLTQAAMTAVTEDFIN